MTDRINWDQDRRLQHDREMRERRQQWEEQRQAEREERARLEKQAQLAAYLRRRGEAYQDTTGSIPPVHLLEQWTIEYTSRQEQEYEAARRAKIAAAEADIGLL